MSDAFVTRGTVTHRRFVEASRAFTYRLFHLLVDVDALDRCADEVIGFGPARVFAIRSTDHFGAADLPLRQKVAAWASNHGVELGAGPLYLWTYPSVLGHVFNPVSWWWSFRSDGTLAAAIAEVNNTFGDWHAYALDDLEWRGATVHATTDKVMHVSPFLPIEGLRYAFAFRPIDLADSSRPIACRLEVIDDDGQVVFEAVQQGRPQPLTTRSLWRAALRHPMVSLLTLVRIHWQAVKLWASGVPFHRRPTPPSPARTGVEA